MRKWLDDLKYKIGRFMYGRYGYDELSRFISVSGLVMLFLSLVPFLRLLYFLALALLIWTWYRAFSRNIYKRQAERQKYLELRYRVTGSFSLWRNMWRERKTHKYFRCPYCRATVRTRRPGKGKKIAVNCPKCGREFIKKT
ncbi:MAG TPA: hypothetical protein PK127_02970 [Clostridiales bacterium]|nr:hypothetical protein [Clostridiales bacterium]HPV01430.1 hypothetical protein [Clostridiales bacterium]